MSDLIERDAVIAEIDKWYDNNRGVDAIEDLIIAINYSLSSVQPSRKGHWIHREDMDYLDENDVTNTHLMCEYCGFIHNFKDNHTAQYNFCPNCGADMRGNINADSN